MLVSFGLCVAIAAAAVLLTIFGFVMANKI